MSHGVSHKQSHADWINSSFEGADESERKNQMENTKAMWMEICAASETEEGADLLERVKEENLDIVADLSARERAEKQMRIKRSMGESGSMADAISSMERTSMSASDAMIEQQQIRAKSESEKLMKMDEWKQREVISLDVDATAPLSIVFVRLLVMMILTVLVYVV
jgi:hypothetical protein